MSEFSRDVTITLLPAAPAPNVSVQLALTDIARARLDRDGWPHGLSKETFWYVARALGLDQADVLFGRIEFTGVAAPGPYSGT